MKYFFTNSTVENTNNVLATVSTKDTVTELSIGLKDLGDKLLATANVTAVGEQVSLNIPCKKPKDWDGQAVTIGVKSQTFQTVMASLLRFKEDVYIDITDGVVRTGVAGKAEVTLDVVSELPDKIEGGDVLLQFVMKDADLQSFIKRGLMTGSLDTRDDGTHNAVVSINVSDGEERGAVTGFSTTRFITSLAKSKAQLPKAPEGNEKAAAQIQAMDEALSKYLEKTGQDRTSLNVVMPVNSVKHLQILSAGQTQVLFSLTEKYVTVALGNVGLYTFRQGAKAPARSEMIEALVGKDTEGAVTAGFDAGTLTNAVSFINDMDRLDGTFGRKAVKLTVKDNGMLMISGNGDKAETNVKVLNGGGDSEAYLNGTLLKDALNVVDKGNLVISFGGSTVVFRNGTSDNISDAGFVFLMKATPDSDEEDTAEGEAEAESES